MFELPEPLRRRIRDHAKADFPYECCGLLVGRGMRCLAVMPTRNVARNRKTRFEVDPRAHIALRRLLRDTTPRLEVVGVYHSHPMSAPVLSERDLAEIPDSTWAYLVAGRTGSRWQIRAFRIDGGHPVRVAVVPRLVGARVQYHRRLGRA